MLKTLPPSAVAVGHKDYDLHLGWIDLAVSMSSRAATVEVSCMPAIERQSHKFHCTS